MFMTPCRITRTRSAGSPVARPACRPDRAALVAWTVALVLGAWHLPAAAIAQESPGAETEATPDQAAAETAESAESTETPATPALPAVPPAPAQPGDDAAPPAPLASAAPVASDARIAGNERAALHFELAETHFAAGRYDQALVELQTVREITGSDEVLYNMGRCYEELGRRETALRDYERFLAANIAGPLQADARERAAALREQIAESQGDDEDDGPGIGTYVGLTLGGVGLAVGAIFGALTLVEDGRLSEGCGATGSCSGEELESIRIYRSVADIAFMTAAIGGTAGLIALVIWLMDRDDESEDEDAGQEVAGSGPTVLPFVLPGHGAGASATVRF